MSKSGLIPGTAPPLPPIQESGGDDHPLGFVVFGDLKPVLYMYELETGIWHWLGRRAEVSPQRLYQEHIQTKCGTWLKQASAEVAEMYARLTARIEQKLCADCGFDTREAPPTIWSGDELLAPVGAPPDPRAPSTWRNSDEEGSA